MSAETTRAIPLSLVPLRLLAFPVVAMVGQVVWMTWFDPTNWMQSAIWIAILSYCWFCIGGLSHELVHDNLHLGTLGIWISRSFGVLLLIPHSVYREVHMRHHAYLNTPLDWEMWPYTDPHRSVTFRRLFLIPDVLLAVFTTPIIWGRICFSKYSPIAPKLRRTMKAEYAACATFWIGVIGLCIWLHHTGRFDFQPKHWIFATPVLLATMLNGIRKLMDHVGTESIDPIGGTRTIVGDNPVTRLLSFFNFDLSVHAPHHRHPKLDHTQLKQRMAEICEKNPDVEYPLFKSFSAALVDTFKRVVVNPGVGLNAGCTDDLSHLPMDQSACGPFNPRPL